jgi:hypothetical protein
MKFSKRGLVGPAVALLGLAASAPASAALTTFQTYVGQYGYSSDGWGSTSQAGTISASVPVGSTVVAAYLYTSTVNAQSANAGGTLAGQPVTFTALGVTPNLSALQAGRADVTSIVKPLIDGGPGGVYSFGITETNPLQDGAALVVVYSNPILGTSTFAILDGFSASIGDSATLSFATPLDKGAGFFAEMSLGIGFSFDGTPCGASRAQTSTVAVNGTVITESAGCNDDSVDLLAENGNLITVGGFDDPYSTLLPSIANDHERYDLTNYIANGSSSIQITTRNPSNDDNIFLAMFYVQGEATVDDGTEVPEPATLGLVAAGLLGTVSLRRRRR